MEENKDRVNIEYTEDQQDDAKSDYEEEHHEDHGMLSYRLRRTLHTRKKKSGHLRPSVPLTDVAVEFFQDMAPQPLGKIDMYLAADITRETGVTPSAMLTGMMYAGKLRKKKSEFLRQVSSTDVFIISMLVASKYLYDDGVDEEVYFDTWADAGHMSIEELDQLERNFLSAIDWSLFVDQNNFEDFLTNVERRSALKSGLERGFFTYTELALLLDHWRLCQAWHDIVKDISTIFLAVSVSYWASVLSVLVPLVALRSLPPTGLSPIAHQSVVPIVTMATVSLSSGTKATLPQENSGMLVGHAERLENEDGGFLRDVAENSAILWDSFWQKLANESEEKEAAMYANLDSVSLDELHLFTQNVSQTVTTAVGGVWTSLKSTGSWLRSLYTTLWNMALVSGAGGRCGHGRAKTCTYGQEFPHVNRKRILESVDDIPSETYKPCSNCKRQDEPGKRLKYEHNDNLPNLQTSVYEESKSLFESKANQRKSALLRRCRKKPALFNNLQVLTQPTTILITG